MQDQPSDTMADDTAMQTPIPPTTPSASSLLGSIIPSSSNPASQTNMRPQSPPLRFATSTASFNLPTSASPGSPSTLPSATLPPVPGWSNAGAGASAAAREISFPSASLGGFGAYVADSKSKVRRPSMLSLTQNASFYSEGSTDGERTPLPPISPLGASSGRERMGNVSEEQGTAMDMVQDPSSSKTINGVASCNQHPPSPLQPVPRWPNGTNRPLQTSLLRRSTSTSNIPMEDLKTSTPPARLNSVNEHELQSEGDTRMDDLTNGKGKTRASSATPQPPLSARPLPSALLQTLIQESAPLEHEIQSEARLQRLLLSHPSKLPLTPRAPRGSRGRFPDQVDDDDDEPVPRRWGGWTGSDSDDDDVEFEEEDNGGEVERSWAGGMEMDRPGSSHSLHSVHSQASGTPLASMHTQPGYFSGPHNNPNTNPPNMNNPTVSQQTSNGPVSAMKNGRFHISTPLGPGMGMVPSPGYGLQSAFGTLGMGTGTPLGSPTVERTELGASPNAPMSSPGLMQYRESSALRPGKRKAAQEERFDPYKRARGTSPGILSSSPYPLSPSRPTSIPIPGSPSHAPIYHSALGMGGSLPRTGLSGIQIHPSGSRANHPYTRPASSKSRAGSPSLGLSASLGAVTGPGSLGSGRGFLGQQFREREASHGSAPGQGQGQGQVAGGLGLLSVSNRVREEEEGDEMEED